MTRIMICTVLLASLSTTVLAKSGGTDDSKEALQGAWVAQSGEANGNAMPADEVKRMQFTFKGDKLLIKGNFRDDREIECPYSIDALKAPKSLDFSPPNEKKPVLGIYEVQGDQLKVCMRHASSDAGRPTEFATKAGSKLILVVFKKQMP